MIARIIIPCACICLSLSVYNYCDIICIYIYIICIYIYIYSYTQYICTHSVFGFVQTQGMTSCEREVQCLLGRVWKQRSGPEHHGEDEYGALPQWVSAKIVASYMGSSINEGIQNGWFIVENPIKMDDTPSSSWGNFPWAAWFRWKSPSFEMDDDYPYDSGNHRIFMDTLYYIYIYICGIL